MANRRLKVLIDNWLWLYPALALVAAAWVLVAFGFSFRTVVVVVFLLFCCAVILWGLVTTRRQP